MKCQEGTLHFEEAIGTNLEMRKGTPWGFQFGMECGTHDEYAQHRLLDEVHPCRT
jgi:hypothetical protein